MPPARIASNSARPSPAIQSVFCKAGSPRPAIRVSQPLLAAFDGLCAEVAAGKREQLEGQQTRRTLAPHEGEKSGQPSRSRMTSSPSSSVPAGRLARAAATLGNRRVRSLPFRL